MYHFNVIFISERYARWIHKEIFRCIEGIGEGEIAFVYSYFVFTESILIIRVFKLSIYFKKSWSMNQWHIDLMKEIYCGSS